MEQRQHTFSSVWGTLQTAGCNVTSSFRSCSCPALQDLEGLEGDWLPTMAEGHDLQVRGGHWALGGGQLLAGGL